MIKTSPNIGEGARFLVGLPKTKVEHLLYYSCATLPALFLTVHPLHFLYTKFHADIAPIGGHSGMDEPLDGSDYHYLHHAKFECNYGVPFPINLDKLFGTWVVSGLLFLKVLLLFKPFGHTIPDRNVIS